MGFRHGFCLLAGGIVILASSFAAPGAPAQELPAGKDVSPKGEAHEPTASITPAMSFSRREILAWQIALESKGFSPGLLDGIQGAKTRIATRAFQLASGLEVTGELAAQTAQALEFDPKAAIVAYTVTTQDEALVSYCPPDWNEKSRRRRLLYSTLLDCLAEKFHTSERCLAALNPTKEVAHLKARDVIHVPGLKKRSTPPPIERLEIDLGRKLILGVSESGDVVTLLHCSVARDLSAVERGETAVASTVKDPEYTFDPKKWPEVKNVTRKLLIPAGPRCPVGLRWIGLERPGVGIHGTAEPENIGKTGSHGCFRLTNWDAVHLASIVTIGMRVSILDRSSAADVILGEEPSVADATASRP